MRLTAGAVRITLGTATGGEVVAPVRAALAARGGRRVIIDLRGNRGGDMRPLLASVTPLLPAGTPLFGFRWEGKPPLWVIQGDGALGYSGRKPISSPAPLLDRVDVLVSRRTASSGEILALALSSYGARLLGEPTGGYLTNNITVKGPGGYQFHITTSDIVTVAGKKVTRLRPAVARRAGAGR